MGIKVGKVICDDCGQEHNATESHQQGQDLMFAVECTQDFLTGYYAEWRVTDIHEV